jgi:PAS domain-containing protein
MSTGVQAASAGAAYRWHLGEQRYEYVMPGLAGITGFPAEELSRMGREQWVAQIHPEDRARVATEVKAVLGGGRATVFYRFLRKDGTYRLLMEHLYVAMEGERPAFLDGVLRDVTDPLSAAGWPAPVAHQGSGLSVREAIGVRVRSSVKRKVAAGVGIAALLVLTFGTGYVMGLRHPAWIRADTALPVNAPGGTQIASRASNPGTAANPHVKKAMERDTLIEAQEVSPQRTRGTVRHGAPAAPSGRPSVAASQATAAVVPPSSSLPAPEAARPSFWSQVAHLPQPIAPDPPSFH